MADIIISLKWAMTLRQTILQESAVSIAQNIAMTIN